MSDYIKREDVLAKAAPWKGAFCDLISSWDVVHIPKEDVAPVVHAAWRQTFVWENKERGLSCRKMMECGKCSYHTNKESPYCPNCGAKMDFSSERMMGNWN